MMLLLKYHCRNVHRVGVVIVDIIIIMIIVKYCTWSTLNTKKKQKIITKKNRKTSNKKGKKILFTMKH